MSFRSTARGGLQFAKHIFWSSVKNKFLLSASLPVTSFAKLAPLGKVSLFEGLVYRQAVLYSTLHMLGTGKEISLGPETVTGMTEMSLKEEEERKDLQEAAKNA